MPRLLPRLRKFLELNDPFASDKLRGPLINKSNRRKIRSLWRPFRQIAPEMFSLEGRSQSILLDEENFIICPEKYQRHKTLPPRPTLQANHTGTFVNDDKMREMTEEERQWWSSPYLRMLGSPLRTCKATERRVPSDLLIRLTILRDAEDDGLHAKSYLVPDGLQHSRFANQQNGVGCHVACWKKAVESFVERGTYKRLAHRIVSHPLLTEQIGHLLRVRVLQEIELLAERLHFNRGRTEGDRVLRRLTHNEWAEIKSSGQIPWPGVACVLVVPQLNKDANKSTVRPMRPAPHRGAEPPPDLYELPPPGKELPPLPPLSVIHTQAQREYPELLVDGNNHLPYSRVPLYNGLSLFPVRSQRSALRLALKKALAIDSKGRDDSRSKGEKSRHAFVVFSNAHTVVRADTVPLAIALWRIRLWEGAGWGKSELTLNY